MTPGTDDTRHNADALMAQELPLHSYLDRATLHGLGPHDLKQLRFRVRKEREAIQAEAISEGPCDDLCRRLNRLDELEAAIGRMSPPVRRMPMRLVLTAIRRGTPPE